MLRIARRPLLQGARSDLLGTDTLLSLGQFEAPTPVPDYLKRKFRLSEQKHMKNDIRERRYALCKRCGLTTMTVNFERVPSARLGLFGRCKGGADYTHHQFTSLAESEYKALQSIPMEKRASWMVFESPARNQ